MKVFFLGFIVGFIRQFICELRKKMRGDNRKTEKDKKPANNKSGG